MKSIKHWLVPGFPVCVLILTGVWAFATPFGRVPGPIAIIQEHQQGQPSQQPEKAITFTGTIIKDGEQYTLRDPSGVVYLLDDSAKAQPFEGKPVKVTGHLGTEAQIIHVDTIELIPA